MQHIIHGLRQDAGPWGFPLQHRRCESLTHTACRAWEKRCRLELSLSSCPPLPQPPTSQPNLPPTQIRHDPCNMSSLQILASPPEPPLQHVACNLEPDHVCNGASFVACPASCKHPLAPHRPTHPTPPLPRHCMTPVRVRAQKNGMNVLHEWALWPHTWRHGLHPQWKHMTMHEARQVTIMCIMCNPPGAEP